MKSPTAILETSRIPSTENAKKSLTRSVKRLKKTHTPLQRLFTNDRNEHRFSNLKINPHLSLRLAAHAPLNFRRPRRRRLFCVHQIYKMAESVKILTTVEFSWKSEKCFALTVAVTRKNRALNFYTGGFVYSTLYL